MLKQHGIQKSHAQENVLYQAIMRHSTRTTQCFHVLALHNDSQKCHSDSVCLTKLNFTTSLLIFFFPKRN